MENIILRRAGVTGVSSALAARAWFATVVGHCLPRRPMTPNAFRKLALGLDGAVEGAHVGHPDFRVGGRIFASLTADGARGMVKVSPEVQRRLLRDPSGAFSPASGAWGRQGCTMVELATAPTPAVRAALRAAHADILRKRRRD